MRMDTSQPELHDQWRRALGRDSRPDYTGEPVLLDPGRPASPRWRMAAWSDPGASRATPRLPQACPALYLRLASTSDDPSGNDLWFMWVVVSRIRRRRHSGSIGGACTRKDAMGSGSVRFWRVQCRFEWRSALESEQTSNSATDEVLAFEQAHYAPDRYTNIPFPPSKGFDDSTRVEETAEPTLTSYVLLQRELLRNTLFTGVAGSLVTFWLSSKEAALSFLLGASVSVVYVFLLGHGVDRMLPPATGRTNLKGGAPASSTLEHARHLTSGPLRILLFIGLVLAVAKQRESLHVLPAFLGFLSFKVAILGQILKTLHIGSQGLESSDPKRSSM